MTTQKKIEEKFYSRKREIILDNKELEKRLMRKKRGNIFRQGVAKMYTNEENIWKFSKCAYIYISFDQFASLEIEKKTASNQKFLNLNKNVFTSFNNRHQWLSKLFLLKKILNTKNNQHWWNLLLNCLVGSWVFAKQR